jgi:Aspartyl protease
LTKAFHSVCRVSGRLVTIDSLRLGDVEMNDLEVAISESGSSGMGLLGMDFLGCFRVHMDYRLNRMELALGEGPYDGRSPEWWQEKFRFYRKLKQTYEKHIKTRKEDFERIQRLASFETHVGDEARLKQVLSEIRAYEGYLRIVKQKIDDLDRRASHAAVPRELRE